MGYGKLAKNVVGRIVRRVHVLRIEGKGNGAGARIHSPPVWITLPPVLTTTRTKKQTARETRTEVNDAYTTSGRKPFSAGPRGQGGRAEEAKQATPSITSSSKAKKKQSLAVREAHALFGATDGDERGKPPQRDCARVASTNGRGGVGKGGRIVVGTYASPSAM